MSKKIKLKELLEENFSGSVMGGVVSRSPFHDEISLSNIIIFQSVLIMICSTK